MSKIIPNPVIQEPSLQTELEKDPNQTKWEAFFSKFSSDEKQQFMKNLNLHFSRLMYKLLEKQKEAARKLKESKYR